MIHDLDLLLTLGLSLAALCSSWATSTLTQAVNTTDEQMHAVPWLALPTFTSLLALHLKYCCIVFHDALPCCSGVLDAAAQAACDYFVYVQQALPDSERVDLQPAVTLSIVLHHYTAWAK
jgi:hypothetical protein